MRFRAPAGPRKRVKVPRLGRSQQAEGSRPEASGSPQLSKKRKVRDDEPGAAGPGQSDDDEFGGFRFDDDDDVQPGQVEESLFNTQGVRHLLPKSAGDVADECKAAMREMLQGLLQDGFRVDPNSNILPLDIDFEDVQRADQYNDVQGHEANPLATLPTIQFINGLDQDDTEVETEYHSPIPSTTQASMEPPPRQASAPDLSDIIPHERITDMVPQKFELALGMWCEETGVSRQQYASLQEILRMLEPHVHLGDNLPNTLSTLQRHTRGLLPALKMRKKTIPLIPEKQASAAEGRKSTQEGRIPTEDLTFFDLAALFQAFLSADEVIGKMHIGLAEFHDEPTELWHSHSWASSIRTTSGQYAHYPETAGADAGDAIFPSEFLMFTCMNASCTENHMGMVHAVARDYRTEATQLGEVIMRVRELYRWKQAVEFGRESGLIFDPAVLEEEVVLSDIFHYIPESHALAHITNIVADHLFDEPHGRGRLLKPTANQLLLRRTIDSVGPEEVLLRPLYQTPPLRAELELKEYGRRHFTTTWDVAAAPVKGSSTARNGTVRRCISVPLLTFIDGFGIYRNSYRSLMGMYVINAALTYLERTRRANVLPLTLGPHGSNFADVCAALEGNLAPLEKGMELKIKGQDVFVSVFTLTYIGDMPQQQVNAGCKTQRANLGCRFCFISAKERRALEYDVVENGRFHYQHVQMRRHAESLSAKGKADYCAKWGISEDSPPLTRLSPALDLLITRPSDPAHSEYQGISRLMHELLMDAILTPNASREYHAQLRVFPFPPGFAKLQSPIHHLKSYSLSDHARWSIIIAPLLRCWLEISHIKPLYVAALREKLQQRVADVTDIAVVNSVVECFAALAKNNSILMASYISAQDRENMIPIIIKCRQMFQSLVACAAASLDKNPRSRAQTPLMSPAASPSASPVPQSQYRSTAGKAMAQKESLPTVHTALHYPDIADEYGLPSQCNTLIGEDKHRWFKKVVYTTNHSNIERIMLHKENFRQTLRLLLLGAFSDSEPQMTTFIQELQQTCPTLFKTLLPRSELESRIIDDEDDDSSISIVADEYHKRPIVIGRLQPKFVRDTLGLPTRGSNNLLQPFRTALRRAYEMDYNMPNMREFGRGTFQWCKKISFHDP